MRFHHLAPDTRPNYSVYLTRAKEDEEFLRELEQSFEVIAEVPPDNLNFVVGDSR